MDLLLSAFNLVHDYPGGAEALGPQIGKAGATLSHEVNPNYPTYKFGLVDAAKLTLITGDRRILNKFSTMCGCYPPMPMLVSPLEDMSLGELMRRCGKVATETGDVMGKFNELGADGDISLNDVTAIQNEITDAVQALTAFSEALRVHVKSIHDRRDLQGALRVSGSSACGDKHD